MSGSVAGEDRQRRYGMVGGGRGAFIGAVSMVAGQIAATTGLGLVQPVAIAAASASAGGLGLALDDTSAAANGRAPLVAVADAER